MTIWVRHPSGISRAIPGIIKIRCWSLLFYRCSPNGNQGIFNSTGETVKPYVAAVGTVYSNTKTVIKSHKSWAKVHFINSYIIRTASNGKRIGRNNQQHSYAMRKAGTYIKLRLCKHEIKINVINYYCPVRLSSSNLNELYVSAWLYDIERITTDVEPLLSCINIIIH